MEENMSRKFLAAFAFTAGLGLVQFAGSALAAPLLPNTSIPAVAEPDPVGATQLASTGPVAFASATYTGSLTSSVFTNDSSNPFGPNALTFTYQLVNNVGSTDEITRLAISRFGAFGTDASFNAGLPVGGVAPTTV